MKQHITKEQWNELNKEQKVLYQKWCASHQFEKPRTHIVGYPNLARDRLFNPPFIGQMIGFLLDCEKDSRYKKNPQPISFYQKRYFIDGYESQWWKIVPDELCDDLWEAVKEALKEL